MIGLIPARGGSKSVLDKNLLSWDGQYPAVISAAKLAASHCSSVYVSTDSEEIYAVAQAHGYDPLWRPSELARDEATIDDLVAYYQGYLGQDLLVVLPTAAGVTDSDIRYMFLVSEAFPDDAVALTTPTHGLIYDAFGNLLTRRKNRQEQAMEAEVGVRYIPRNTDPHHYRPVISSSPITEIDTPIDLMVARHQPKSIAIAYLDPEDHPDKGSGHKRRATAIARELQHHDVWLGSDAGLFEIDADVVILDILDTSREFVNYLAASSKVITIEDLGEGAKHADAVVNALYDPAHSKYVDLRPEFWGLRHEEFASDKTNVLVTFGGTDPANLGMRFTGALIDSWLDTRIRIQQVTPQSPINMAKAMMENHIVITSAGRTLHEAAYLGVPAISIAANIRETTHSHLGPQWGNVYLGHHETVTDQQFIDAFSQLLDSHSWRKELTSNRYLDHLGVQRIARLAERLAEE